MSRRSWDRLFAASLVLAALVYLPKVALAESALYTDVLSPQLLLNVAAVFKIAFLALATAFAARCVPHFESEATVRSAWRLLAAGLGLYLLGQTVLGVYQIVLRVATPFPSLADLFFQLSMLVLIVALVVFLSAYSRTLGVALGELAGVGLGALVVLVLVGVVVLRPIAAEEAPLAERLLNLAYPILDCLLLVPGLMLLRLTLKLRGGSLWTVWLLLLLGFFCVAVGDILFAYFTTHELVALDPLLDLVFVAAYVLFAWGTRRQLAILEA